MKAFKRFGTYLAVCLAMAMLLTTMPAAAFAQGAPEGDIPAAGPVAETGGIAGDDITTDENTPAPEEAPGPDDEETPPPGENGPESTPDALPPDADGDSADGDENEAGAMPLRPKQVRAPRSPGLKKMTMR